MKSIICAFLNNVNLEILLNLDLGSSWARCLKDRNWLCSDRIELIDHNDSVDRIPILSPHITGL